MPKKSLVFLCALIALGFQSLNSMEMQIPPMCPKIGFFGIPSLALPKLVEETSLRFESFGSNELIIQPEIAALFQRMQNTLYEQTASCLPLSGFLFSGSSKTALTEHAKKFARQCRLHYILFDAKTLIKAYKQNPLQAIDLIGHLFVFAQNFNQKIIIIAQDVQCLRQFIIGRDNFDREICTFMKECRQLLRTTNTCYSCIQLYIKPSLHSPLPKIFKHTNIVHFDNPSNLFAINIKHACH